MWLAEQRINVQGPFAWQPSNSAEIIKLTKTKMLVETLRLRTLDPPVSSHHNTSL